MAKQQPGESTTEQDPPVNRSRRRLLIGAGVVGGGLIIGVPLLRGGREPLPLKHENAFTPNAFLQITPSNEVHFYVPRNEMGQGINHGLATLVGEELRLDPARIVIHHAGVHEDYRNPAMGQQITGGSTSMSGGFTPLRQAAANAREAIRMAAAQSLGVDASVLKLQDGLVSGAGEARGYGDFADLAGTLPVPESAPLTPAAEFRFIGKNQPRIDAPAKATGQAVFGIDVDFPGLKKAVVVRAPVIGGSVEHFDASGALEMPGVVDIFAIDQGIAVVADSTWQARQAAAAVEARWQLPDLAQWSTADVEEALRNALDKGERKEASYEGDAKPILASAQNVLEADYYAPYLAHATMEPMNCTVRFDGERCEIWVPNQGPELIRSTAAFHSGLPKENITVHSTQVGGGFGRRAYPDFVVEALQVARQSGHPVQVVWSREDDMRHDYYRPATRARYRAALDDQGRIEALEVVRAGPNILGHMLDEFAGAMAPAMLPDGMVNWAGERAHGIFRSWTVDPTSVEGLFEDYQVSNLSVQHVSVDPGLRIGFWRAVGHSYSAFFKESFIDELAHAAGRDPLAFRLDHIAAGSRLRPLLERTAAAAGWGAAPAGRFQGLAVHSSFGSAVAQIAELSIEDGKPRVHRVTCAVDCGLVVNPQIVEQQMRSSIVYGLTAALFGRIDLDKGAVRQGNFHDYPALRMMDTPRMDVILMPGEGPPTGVGEPGLPPIAPAVANAIFAATGKRLRDMPLQLA